MREFEKPIGRVWRRMRLQRFLSALVWTLAGSLMLAALAIGASKVMDRPLPGPDWSPFALAGGCALIVAGAIALLTGPSRIDAAVAIDREFHLNERLSTALTLPSEMRETSAGRALVADTIRHVDRLDIGSKFRLRLPRRAWVPLVSAGLAVGFLFVPNLVPARANRTAEKVETQAVSRASKTLGKSIGEKRKELDKAEFAKTEKILAEIEKAADKLAKSPPSEKDKALVELNKLTDALKDRQKALGSPEEIKNQLQQLDKLTNSGPADEFAKNLMQGDFKKAAEELKSLQEKLASDKLNEAEKKELRDQLGAMKQQLEKLANQDELKKQLEKKGLSKAQIEQQLAKVNEQTKESRKKLQKLAQQLGQCEKCMANGDLKKAADALGMSQQQLSDLAKQAQELETLDSALADLQEAKNGMTGGDGMNQLGNGLDDLAGDRNMGMGQGDQPGNGLGYGQGRGRRPEAPDSTNAYNTSVKPQVGPGKAVLQGFAPPREQMKGESVIEIQETTEAASALSAEALSNQKVPNNVKKHIGGYFDALRKGQ